ncbi:MAG: OmpH family outer membrane protein, partial [Alistipes sp.]|nr:OmpH family outer membrane protein [Alistipes sp.]
QDLSNKEGELMTPIFELANEAVKKVSQAGGYLVVFNTANAAAAGLAYYDEAALTDITDLVKAELNITE